MDKYEFVDVARNSTVYWINIIYYERFSSVYLQIDSKLNTEIYIPL